MSDSLEQFRKDIITEIDELALQYIEAVVFFEDYEKGNLHWKFTELLCAYVKGRSYDQYEDAGLLLFYISRLSKSLTTSMKK